MPPRPGRADVAVKGLELDDLGPAGELRGVVLVHGGGLTGHC
jgi:hypothetical protein